MADGAADATGGGIRDRATSDGVVSAPETVPDPSDLDRGGAGGEASTATWRPTRAVVDDSRAGSALVDELKSRGVEVLLVDFEEFLRPGWLELRRDHDLVVGNFAWTREALRRLHVAMPDAPDYPDCLKHLLHRRVWQSTLGDITEYVKTAEHQTFVKPAADAKAFSAVIEPKDQMLEVILHGIPDTTMLPMPSDTPVFCAEVVNMISEWRCYVVNGEIRAMCHYGGGSKDVAIDMDIVRGAVRTLAESDEGRDVAVGCGIDFAVMKRRSDDELLTCLVEVNDGYSIGAYAGLTASDEADLLIARWGHLVGAKVPT